ncbi:Aldehyde/histidinol dehydrogenase [Xylaria bambusicola]|uniref:Aldehyde/histidinol dehydrogenase n=1 Tax=Xylaria bambusicola TaxID=326684 RepID=UPI002008AE7B|nr:Aldehyde/histidinol dehydrogenase [Xylaria bambusicola]KAI0508256.1 Aldehyde/histidinol dehydrogenase [Xylaria bambusicola]
MPATIANGDAPELAFHNIVDGKPRSSDVKEQVIDPRTEEVGWDVPVASAQDLDDAVDAARRAFKTWRFVSHDEREKILQSVADCLRTNKDVLAQAHMKETGKSFIMASADVEVAALHYEYYKGMTLEDDVQYEDAEVKIVGTYVPIGVTAAISPWNFPLILSSVKVASALATGNCVIIKPSPFTPYAILKFCELVQSVLPPGVFQALHGGADLGERMTLHRGIDQISFTGTVAVGQHILQNCTKTMKKVILEMAGNDAAIICEDADLGKVIPSVAHGCFFHAGQVCVASKRIYVHESLYDKFMELFIEEAKKWSPNNILFAPLSNRPNFERAKSILEDSKKNNHDIVLGGEVKNDEKGFWLPPTIIAKPPEESRIVQEEQFAPITPVMIWSDEDDVIARANLENSGLGASLYTPDLDKARRIAQRLESGSVWINRFERPHFGAYFAGWKLSGFGGELGKRGLYDYCQVQCLHFHK